MGDACGPLDCSSTNNGNQFWSFRWISRHRKCHWSFGVRTKDKSMVITLIDEISDAPSEIKDLETKWRTWERVLSQTRPSQRHTIPVTKTISGSGFWRICRLMSEVFGFAQDGTGPTCFEPTADDQYNVWMARALYEKLIETRIKWLQEQTLDLKLAASGPLSICHFTT